MPELFSSVAIADYLRGRGYDLVDATDQHIIVRFNLSGRDVQLMGKFTSRFPFEPPPFYVLNRLQCGHLAHVGWRQDPSSSEDDIGLVCRGVSIARSVNFEAPELVFEYGLEAACSVLAKAFESEEYNLSEVLAEFSGHWRFHCKKPTGRHIVLVEPGSTPEGLSVYMLSSGLLTYCPKEILANDGYGLIPRKKDRPDTKGLYIPIDTPVLPPAPQEAILEWWHSTVLPTLPNETLTFLEGRCRTHYDKRKPYNVIILPRRLQRIQLPLGKMISRASCPS